MDYSKFGTISADKPIFNLRTNDPEKDLYMKQEGLFCSLNNPPPRDGKKIDACRLFTIDNKEYTAYFCVRWTSSGWKSTDKAPGSMIDPDYWRFSNDY